MASYATIRWTESKVPGTLGCIGRSLIRPEYTPPFPKLAHTTALVWHTMPVVMELLALRHTIAATLHPFLVRPKLAYPNRALQVFRYQPNVSNDVSFALKCKV